MKPEKDFPCRIVSPRGHDYYGCIPIRTITLDDTIDKYSTARNHIVYDPLRVYNQFVLSRIDELISWDEQMVSIVEPRYKNSFFINAIEKCNVALKIIRNAGFQIQNLGGELVVTKHNYYSHKKSELKIRALENAYQSLTAEIEYLQKKIVENEFSSRGEIIH